jgi:hypothetical protein
MEKKMNLRLIRLLSGEDVVGDLTVQDEDYRIENPVVLGLMMGQNGKPNLQMQPMLIFSEQKVVTLKANHVLYDVTVAPEIKNKYNEIYGSGIVVPPQQKIIT